VRSTGSDIEFLSLLNEMIYFKVEVNDTYNTAIVGKAVSYCLNEECIFPNVKGILNK